MAGVDQMRTVVGSLLKGIDRYNPENLGTLERYVELQAKENSYDLEANLAVLKLYQFNPAHFQTHIAAQILLKALTNLPHTDFVLCKCLIEESHQQQENIMKILNLHEMLETCNFKKFWSELKELDELVGPIKGFSDSIRKFVCHVVGITYQRIQRPVLAELLGDVSASDLQQWVTKYGWEVADGDQIFVAIQEESIKTKNITEKIDFESVASIIALT